MKRTVIVGAGFAGLTAAGRLSAVASGIEVIAIDRKKTFDFLPLLPDLLGRGINPDFLSYPLERIFRSLKVKFLNLQVLSLDLEKKQLLLDTEKLSFDYLLIASGSETNFYGNEAIQANAYKLDDLEDAQKIKKLLWEKDYLNFVIAGAGYTGVEVATNLRLFLQKNKKSGKIMLIEKAPAILGPLPGWMKEYVAGNLKKMAIEVLVNSGIEKIEGDKILLSNGKTFQRALVIWTAGVKSAKFIQDLKSEKNPQGRLKTDEYLRLNNSCFVSGDAAYFPYHAGFLRMAVQFAITQGECAAGNILNQIKGRKLVAYRPFDPGYIIPMANNHSCGKILGLNLKGILPTWLHFFMCIYRTYGTGNKLGLIKGLLNLTRH